MKTHSKVWLWILLIANILSTLSYIPLTIKVPIYGIYLVLSLGMAASACLLLFKLKKLGFYLFCGLAVVVFVMNMSLHINIITALIGLIAGPLITYLFLKASWDCLT